LVADALPPQKTTTPATTSEARDADATRQEVADALADPTAAFERYLAQRLGEAGAALARSSAADKLAPLSAVAAAAAAGALPPSLRELVPAMGSSGAERARRQAIFSANLREASALNAAALRDARARNQNPADAPVYGLTDYSHLTRDEFRRMYLGRPFAQIQSGASGEEAAAAAAAVAATSAAPDEAAAAGEAAAAAATAAASAAAAPGEAAAAGEAAGASAASASAGPGTRRRRRARRALAQAPPLPPFHCGKEVAFPHARASVPSRHDWRNVRGVAYVTPVRSQGSCGSCAAFAVAAVLEAVSIRRVLAARRRRGAAAAAAAPPVAEAADLAESDFLDCWDPSTDQCEGAMPSWYLDRAVCKGVASERDVPYAARDGNACAAVARDTLGLKGWFQVPVTERALKQAVFHGPVAVGIRAGGGALGLYQGGVIPCGTLADVKGYVDHAVTIIGWDAGSFIAKNSWGTGWGEGGYLRLASGCAKGESALNMLTDGGYNVAART